MQVYRFTCTQVSFEFRIVQNISKRMKLLRLGKLVVFHDNESLVYEMKIRTIGSVINAMRVYIKT